MREINFKESTHARTVRDYKARILNDDKAECAIVAKQWGHDYWDGERKFGYGGMTYDGRWNPYARKLVEHYGLRDGDRVLEVGCGKGFLLYELTRVVSGLEVTGIDISRYAIENGKEEVKPFLRVASATNLPFEAREFDLVLSIETLHNLPLPQLTQALGEIERVSRRDKYLVVPSWRNDRERVNFLYWQVTCESFLSVDSWRWLFEQVGYTGDCGFDYYT